MGRRHHFMSCAKSNKNNDCENCQVEITKLSENSVKVCLNILPVVEKLDLTTIRLDFPLCDDQDIDDIFSLFSAFELTVS